MADKSILLGLHNQFYLDAVVNLCNVFGYSTDVANNFTDMLEKAQSKQYQRYLMDINFGKPGAENIEPAKQVYKIVKQHVESGSSKFMAVSGIESVVSLARKEGIPAEDKGNLRMSTLLE